MTELAKILSCDDIDAMEEIVKNDELLFNKDHLKNFLEKEGNYAFGWVADDKIVGFGYAYALLRPDGKNMFYLHSIGLLEGYQNAGRGTKLFQYIVNFARENGFSEIFVITDKANPRACRIYEKAGAKNDYDDEVVYVIDFDKL